MNAPLILIKDLWVRHTTYSQIPSEKNPKKTKRKQRIVQAINDVSLTVYPGETVGIIGVNGSGKSTLLSSIAGLTTPYKGIIRVRETPEFLSLSGGLHTMFTGRMNAELGLLAKGLAPSEVDEAVEEVARFARLGDAFDRDVETYSSGMRARLGFAIATYYIPKILLIDEALSVGDAGFQEQCHKRLQQLNQGAHAVVIVSHNMFTIEQMCDWVLWLHQGEIVKTGPAKETIELYQETIKK